MSMAFLVCISIVAFGLAACSDQQAGGSVTGTYRLVKDQELMDGVRAVAAHDSLGAAPEAAEQISAMIEAMNMALVIREDGTFTASGSFDKPFSAEGEWSLEGSTLTLTTTVQDGTVRETPRVETMVFEGDAIRKPRDEKVQPFDLVLRRE